MRPDRDAKNERNGRRAGAPALSAIVAILTLLLGATGAAAARPGHDVPHAPRPHQAPRLVLATKPAAAEEGTSVRLTGSVKGHLDAPPARYLVSLQSTAKGKFATIASGRLEDRRFAMRMDVPAGLRGVHLRLRLRLGTSQVAQTKPWKLAIRARPTAPVPPPATTPPPAPGSKTVVLSPASVLAAPAPGTPGCCD